MAKLPLLNRSYSDTSFIIPQNELVTIHFGIPKGSVKKVLVKNLSTVADSVVYICINTQHSDATGTYYNIDENPVKQRLRIRLREGYSKIPWPADSTTAYLIADDSSDAIFVIHHVKSSNRMDEFILVGSWLVNPIEAGIHYLEASDNSWYADVVSAELIDGATTIEPNFNKYFQVSGEWVRYNGITLPYNVDDSEKEIAAFNPTTDQAGIETLTLWCPDQGGQTVRVESIEH